VNSVNWEKYFRKVPLEVAWHFVTSFIITWVEIINECHHYRYTYNWKCRPKFSTHCI